MEFLNEITAELRGLPEWGARVFAAGCAHRAKPLVQTCSSASTTSLYERALDALWSGSDGATREDLSLALEATPEIEAESSAELEYFAKVPIVMLTIALYGGTHKDPGDVGRRACALALELHETIDYMLTDPAKRPRTINPKELPPPGEHEKREIEAERKAIMVLRSGSEWAGAVPIIRAMAESHAIELVSVMPRFLEALRADAVKKR